jgi:putative hydroxymethylpyrimidine transport system substrate-binding protein
MRRALLSIVLVAGAIAAGCGSSASHATPSASLVLDFTPNAVHAGIYAALAHRYDRAAGVDLHVIVPSASTDSISLLEAGKVNFAILDIHDLAIARERGAPLVGIMAIVQRPLAAVIAAPSVSSPRLLSGRTVGVTGDPSDLAVLHSVMAGSGADPHSARTITIGFNAVADLLSGRVAAATAFWNDEGVKLAKRRPGFHVFRVDDYGAPSYPELVVCATAAGLRRDPALARSLVRALVRGYGFVVAHPSAGASELESQVRGLDPKLVAAQLAALVPAFKAPDGRIGELSLARLRVWAQWEARFGIVSARPDVGAIFDPAFAASAAQ